MSRRRFRTGLLQACAVLAFSCAEPAWAQPDPGDTGPFAVTRSSYNFGDTAFTPKGFPGPVEVRGEVTFPTDLSAGPFPFIVFLHGRHATCFQGGSAFLEWPCSGARQPIPSHEGYRYVADVLASWGYVVVSISANGINARDNSVFDLGMNARAQLIQHHLDRWNVFSTTGGPPFGDMFVDRVDLQNVGTMGHSRGGEGVVQHVLYNDEQGTPYAIRAVLPIAPVDFNRPVINLPLALLMPYCDGDVSDLQGIHFFDDARYNLPGDLSAKHSVLVQGANHNFFNTVWTPGLFPAGTADDWLAFVGGGSGDPHCGTVAGNRRLTPAQQRSTGAAYMSAFFRANLGGEADFLPYLTGDAAPPPSAMTSDIVVSYHPPDDPSQRLDVNRLTDLSNLTVNTLGGTVVANGLAPYLLCGGEVPQPQHCLVGQPNSRQPHTTPSARSPRRGLSQLHAGWDDATASYENELPDGLRDVSGYSVLQFRVGVNFTDARNEIGVPQDFSITLVDATGASATTPVSSYSTAVYYPPGGRAVTPLPKVILNTVRIPLFAFADVDLTQIATVQFNFDQLTQGALLFADILFAAAQ